MEIAGQGVGDVVLRAEDLCKSYVKGVLVNDHISLPLYRGEIFGLLGPNGAGKTTLISQFIGLAKPDSGSIMLDGVDIVAHPGYARQACSFQAQTQVPINGLTAKQAVELVGQVRGGDLKSVGERSRRLLKTLEMEEWANKSAETFSGGMRRLVAFCMAAVVPGQIVILDEPTNDIDPLRRRLLWQEVRSLVGLGSTVLLVTHNVMEAERAVDRLAIMDKGKIVGVGTPGSLKDSGSENMRFELILEPRAALPETPPFLRDAVVTGRRLLMSHSRQRGCPMEAMNPRDNWLGRVLCLTCDVREEEGRFNIGALVPVYERGLGERTCMSLVTSGRIPFQRVYLWRSSPFGLS